MQPPMGSTISLGLEAKLHTESPARYTSALRGTGNRKIIAPEDWINMNAEQATPKILKNRCTALLIVGYCPLDRALNVK